MRYRLVFVTHGWDLDTVTACLASAADNLIPAPADILIVRDGPGPNLAPIVGAAFPAVPSRLSASDRPDGFCSATGRAWNESARDGADWIYWLEHDFLHLEQVDLRELAAVLTGEPQVAQMSLMRGPANDLERKAGSLVALNPDAYRRREGQTLRPFDAATRESVWLEHRRYWTTNPHLRRRDLALDYPWPLGPECEGRFALELREQRPETTFGIWAEGEQLVEHVGTRSGFGY